MVIIRWVIGFLLLLVFTLFAFVVWLALNEDVVSEGGEPPLIRAEGLPYKEEPSERGGDDVLNEDSSLVQALDRGPDEPVIERILPPQGEPPRSAAEVLRARTQTDSASSEAAPTSPSETIEGLVSDGTGEETDTQPEIIVSAPVEALESAEPSSEVAPIEPVIPAIEAPEIETAPVAAVPPVADPPVAPSVTIPQPLPPAVVAPAADAPATPRPSAPTNGSGDLPRVFAGGSASGATGIVTIEEPEAPVASAPLAQPAGETAVPVRTAPATDSFRVQLSALRQPDQAERAWSDFQARYPEILGDGEVFIEESTTDRGLFYRVQAGLYGSRADADAACNALKAQGGDCFVVRGAN